MWRIQCGINVVGFYFYFFVAVVVILFMDPHPPSPPPALPPSFFFPAELQNSSRNDHGPAASAAVWASVAGPRTWKRTRVQPALYFGAFNLSSLPSRPQSSLLYSIVFPTFTPMITSHSLWQSIRCKKKRNHFAFILQVLKNTGPRGP